MNIPFDFSRLETFDFRKHYEKVGIESLKSLVRHKPMIAKIIVCGLVLAAILVAALPRHYSAEVLVQPQLFSRGEPGGTTALASIDGASLVASEAALIQSPAVAKAVVKRLGLDKRPEFAQTTSLVGRAFRNLCATIFPETILRSPLERATQSLRAKLTVTRDTRSYLISIGFTASTPEEAAHVANAFALEYVNTKTIQRLSQAVATANSELARSATIYGESHPSYVRAIADLELAQERLRTAINRPVGTDLAPSEGIAFAEPNPTPSSPNGVAILGLAFFFSLLLAAGLSIWIDFRRAEPASTAGSERK